MQFEMDIFKWAHFDIITSSIVTMRNLKVNFSTPKENASLDYGFV